MASHSTSAFHLSYKLRLACSGGLRHLLRLVNDHVASLACVMACVAYQPASGQQRRCLIPTRMLLHFNSTLCCFQFCLWPLPCRQTCVVLGQPHTPTPATCSASLSLRTHDAETDDLPTANIIVISVCVRLCAECWRVKAQNVTVVVAKCPPMAGCQPASVLCAL